MKPYYHTPSNLIIRRPKLTTTFLTLSGQHSQLQSTTKMVGIELNVHGDENHTKEPLSPSWEALYPCKVHDNKIGCEFSR